MGDAEKKRNSNKSVLAASAVFACVLWLGGFLETVPTAQGEDMYVYPKQGQDKAQQDKDTYECHSWAVQQTGFDPTKPPSTSTQTQSSQQQGQVARGAARGAALGAVGGAIAGDAGKGAAVGAGVGATGGAMRKRGAQKEQQAQQQAAQQEYQNNVQGYNRAKATCLEGRGYSVSY